MALIAPLLVLLAIPRNLRAQDNSAAISSNPGGVNIIAGTGLLGRTIGLTPDTGVRLGGVWVGDSNYFFGNSALPGKGSFNSLLVLDLNFDEKALKVPGAQIGLEYLQFNGQATNAQAGVVTGYNSLPGAPPLYNRTEFYQLYWRQRLFSDKFIFRLGKSVPTYDFNNVIRAVPVTDSSLFIPAVSGLFFTPVFVNTTLLGALPGYYNSAYGLTATFAPIKQFYASYGIYDGNVANGTQTGLQLTPQFNGYYFNIGEAGTAWLLGQDSKPGTFSAGGWGQSGKLTAAFNPKNTQDGAEGFYTFATQRLWFRHPGVDSSGISSFAQFGINNSHTMFAHKYVGGGVTAFGLVPKRPNDSAGAGVAASWLNQNASAPPFRGNEVILQAYYQMQIINGIYFGPAVSYVPDPAAVSHIYDPGGYAYLPPATAVTARVTLLF